MGKADGPGWAKGHPVARIKQISSLFQRFERGVVQGAFTRCSDLDVVEWLERGQLLLAGRSPGKLDAAAVVWRPRSRTAMRAFGDTEAGWYEPGQAVVRRAAWQHGKLGVARQLVRDGLRGEQTALAELWLEDPRLVQLYAPWQPVPICTRVKSSSELQGVVLLRGNGFDWQPTPEAELAGLTYLGGLGPGNRLLLQVQASLERAQAGWAAHYSSYQRGASWSALALQGYSPDPQFIGKPAEMGRKWLAANPGSLGWPLQRTPLAATRLGRGCLQLLRLLGVQPSRCDRIRLMRLEPGGGELTRHADLDKDAGVADGKLMRLHLPLLTNPLVVFQQWLLDGRVQQACMGTGELWYLDQRKPHTAANNGGAYRIHLVADVAADDRLRARLLAGTPAGVVG